MEKRKENRRKKHNAGITLIALIITIIILLILAMVTIRVLMNQGIIKHANDATSQYKIAEEKEKIALGYQNYKMDKIVNPNAELTVDTATVEGSEADGGWTITFTETGNVYELDTKGNITKNEDPSQDEIAKIKAGYNKYQSDKEAINRQIEQAQAEAMNNINQADLDLLRQYCIGNNDKDLLQDVIEDPNSMIFKNREPIPNASEELTFVNTNFGNDDIAIIFAYHEATYQLICGFLYNQETGDFSYPTKKVEPAVDTTELQNQLSSLTLTVEGATATGDENSGWTILFGDSGNKYTLTQEGEIDSIAKITLSRTDVLLNINNAISSSASESITATVTGGKDKKVIWSIADENIAKIDKKEGKTVTITGVSIGNTKLTATCGVTTETCSIYVKDSFPIGEYINYDCGASESNKLYYKSLRAATGRGRDQEFEITSNPRWQILGRSDSGNILITTAAPIKTKDSDYFGLADRPGYVNGPDELDAISEIFGHGAHAAGARSITVEDVNKITRVHLNDTYTKYTYTKNAEDGKIYRNGATSSETSAYWYYENDNPKGEWKQIGTGETSPEIADTSYSYFIATSNSTTSRMLIGTYSSSYGYYTYWLASRSVSCNDGDVGFHLRYVYGGCVYSRHPGYYFYSSTGTNGSYITFAYVRPVVSLEANVKIEYNSADQIWEIK